VCCFIRLRRPGRSSFEIYNWLTEGFDTADLKEAKALLKELSIGSGGHALREMRKL
jgi:hypothetical protein